MSKTSFKAFVAEATVQTEVMASVRKQLGTSDFTSSETIDEKMLKDARRVSHKFVDTSNGPWVVEVLESDDKKFARATPPKGSNGKPQYFIPNKPVEVEEDEIFVSAELIFEAHAHNVIGTIYGSNKFSYDKSTKTFSAEASDLGGNSFLKHVFNDAADIGFRIESVKTGDQVIFTLAHEHRDREHDITHWTYNVYNPKRDPKLDGLKVVIFND